MRLQGKKAVVTGGGQGIGQAIALGFAREGADVVVGYAQREAAAEDTVAQIRALGRSGLAVRLDVSVRQDVERLVEQALASLGRIDVLVNNASVLTRQAFLELPEEEFERVIAVDLKGPFLLGQAVARQMVAQGGAVASSTSLPSAPNGLSGPSRTTSARRPASLCSPAAWPWSWHPIASELTRLPHGLTATEMNRSLREEHLEQWSERAGRIPLGRAGRPQDHVGAAVFLASDEAEWVTGATIAVDGGQTVA